jgi:hypothetical protein
MEMMLCLIDYVYSLDLVKIVVKYENRQGFDQIYLTTADDDERETMTTGECGLDMIRLVHTFHVGMVRTCYLQRAYLLLVTATDGLTWWK